MTLSAFEPIGPHNSDSVKSVLARGKADRVLLAWARRRSQSHAASSPELGPAQTGAICAPKRKALEHSGDAGMIETLLARIDD